MYYVLHILLKIVRHSRFGHCKMSLKISGTYLPSLNNYEIFSILKKAEVRILTLTDYGHPNKGINQRYLKNWADVADKYASAVPKNLGVGVKAISSLGIHSPW